MITYQDLLKVLNDHPGDEREKMNFTLSVIQDYERSELYQNALLADEYDKQRNRTIVQYKKVLYTLSGDTVPDNFSANYKMCSNFYDFFALQENQYLFGNGITWGESSTEKKLGPKFSTELQTLGKNALIHAVSYGFWNLDHLESFSALEFCPLYDEENGSLMSGVRKWRIDKTKPLRATLYEPDGYTEYIWKGTKGEILQEKRPYILHYSHTDVDGTEIYDGENYPSFPIIPMWCDKRKQAPIVGLRENIDAYDLIKSGFANDLDDASQIYWILKDAGSMDDVDLTEFRDRLKRLHVASISDNVQAEQHTTEVPYNAREALLTRLRDDMFEQAMAFDPKKLASGGSVVTAAIKAAYSPLDGKTDEFEYCVDDFLDSLLKLIGIDDTPTFTRSIIVNESDQIQTLMSAAEYLPEDYLTKKVLTILGDGDQAESILKEMQESEMERMQYQQTQFNNNQQESQSQESNTENPDEE